MKQQTGFFSRPVPETGREAVKKNKKILFLICAIFCAFVFAAAVIQGISRRTDDDTNDDTTEKQELSVLETSGSVSSVASGNVAPAVFTDIDGHPKESYILTGLERGLYRIPPDGLFRPDDPVTCGEYALMLWNLAGRPDVPGQNADETADMPNALLWLNAQGWVNDTDFSPDSFITRQEAMNLLYAFNGNISGMEAMFTSIYDRAFSDSSTIPDGGKPALYWSFYNVLIRETEPDHIDPFGLISRGDSSEIMIRYMDDFLSGSPEQ